MVSPGLEGKRVLVGFLSGSLLSNLAVVCNVEIISSWKFLQYLIESNIHLEFHFGFHVLDDNFSEFRAMMVLQDFLGFHYAGPGFVRAKLHHDSPWIFCCCSLPDNLHNVSINIEVLGINFVEN